MEKIYVLILICIYSFAKADSWTQKASLPAADRAAAAGFSLNGMGYIGTGIKFAGPVQFHNDFWQYNPANNSWAQKANLAGAARSGAVGFSVLGKGHIACGHDGNNVLQDVWQYDDALNTWTQKAALPGPGRNYTVAFSIDSFAYIGTGYNSMSTSYKDFWQYNPVANAWVQKADAGSLTRSSAIAFAAGGKGYIGAGYDATYMNDFWQYDPLLNTWTQKANTPGGARSDASAFTINGYGYILTGQTSLTTANDLWRYDHVNNTWSQKLNLSGSARTDAVAFSIGNKGYIGTGWDPVFNSLNDLWEYTPDSTTSVEENGNDNFHFTISPNPANEFLVISSEFGVKEKIAIIITDINGKKVYHYNLDTRYLILDTKINVSTFSNGIYFVTVDDGNQKEVKKFIKN